MFAENGGITLVEKMFEYLENHSVLSVVYKTQDAKINLNGITIEDIEQKGKYLQVYFNADDYLYINPSEYSCLGDDGEYKKNNGDYIVFFEGEDYL